MVPNVVKGSGFRGLCNYLLVGRKDAVVIGGNMVGRTAVELTREFGMLRRLRPGPVKPVMHHTLSFADGEDPGNGMIGEIAESYIRRMGLESHQWVAVVHRDKAHVHVHLAINRIGLDVSWWNATHDFERAQVVAGQVEAEFGLIRVARARLRSAIDKAIVAAKITPPALSPAPGKPDHGIKHVLDEIRTILEAIPPGLQTPEWIQAVEAEGLHLKPSIGGQKISGFTVTLPGHRAVKLADVSRSLSWPKLQSSGRVIYDPELHFDFVSSMRRKEPSNASPTSSSTSHSSGVQDDERWFDEERGEWRWGWQSAESGVVVRSVGTSPGAGTVDAGRFGVPGTPDFRQEGASGSLAVEAPRAGAASGRGSGKTAAGVRRHGKGTAELPFELDIDLLASTPSGPEQHVLGGGSERQYETGPSRDRGVDADGPDARPQGPPGAAAPPREPTESVGRGFPSGSSQTPARDRGSDPSEGEHGWRGIPRHARDLIGARVDFEDLGRSISLIPPLIRQAARAVVAFEEKKRLSRNELDRRALLRESLWEETQEAGLTPEVYRVAKASLLGMQHHLGLARSVVRDLTAAAKQGTPFLPPSAGRPIQGVPSHQQAEGRSAQKAKPSEIRKPKR